MLWVVGERVEPLAQRFLVESELTQSRFDSRCDEFYLFELDPVDLFGRLVVVVDRLDIGGVKCFIVGLRSYFCFFLARW